MTYKIVTIPGDGIGPEVINIAIDLLGALPIDIKITYHDIGRSVFDKIGVSVTSNTIAACREADAVLFGATTTPPNLDGYTSAILTLRHQLDLYSNVRPIRSYEGLFSPVQSPPFDIVIFRENTEGLYSNCETFDQQRAITQRIFTKDGCQRIIQAAIDYVTSHNRQKLTLVHKSNVLRATDGMFLQLFYDMCESQFGSNVCYDDMLVDTSIMRIITHPQDFDVIVTSNLFGDILSDAGAALMGGVGMAASANIGDEIALFEPVHGTAPDIVCQDRANPYGTLFSVVMMLEYLGEMELAHKLHSILKDAIANGLLTPDVGGMTKSSTIRDYLLHQIKQKLY